MTDMLKYWLCFIKKTKCVIKMCKNNNTGQKASSSIDGLSKVGIYPAQINSFVSKIHKQIQ